jgi:hypothetical protein
MAALAALFFMTKDLKELLELLSEIKGEPVVATKGTVFRDDEDPGGTREFELVTRSSRVPVSLLQYDDIGRVTESISCLFTEENGRMCEIADRVETRDDPSSWVVHEEHPFFRR